MHVHCQEVGQKDAQKQQAYCVTIRKYCILPTSVATFPPNLAPAACLVCFKEGLGR